MTDAVSALSRSTGATPSIPVEPSISPVFFERERDKVFRRTWLKLARVAEIPNVGDFVVREVEVLNASVLIVRNEAGQIRAYHNVCPHRGNRLANQCEGKARAFTCSFHGWSFDLQGRLRYVHDEASFCGLDKSATGLVPVNHEEWMGFIFVNFNKEPHESLKEYLGDVASLTEGYPHAEMVRVGHYRAIVKCNWKTIQDAFSEAYHVQIVHRRSLPDLRKELIPRKLARFGRHGNMSATMSVKRDPSPTERAIWSRSTGFMRSGTNSGLPAGLNRDRQPNWAFDQFVLFPNLNLILGNGWSTTHEYWPISVDETRWEASYYASNATSPVACIANEFFKVRVRDTVREDLSTIESAHAGQKSGVISRLLLSSHEDLLAHHRDVLNVYMTADSSEGGPHS